MSEKVKPKKLSRFEKLIGSVTLVLSAATVFIGWKTYELNKVTTQSESEINRLEAQIKEDRLQFDQHKEVYDRITEYLGTDQDAKQGIALIALIELIPDETVKNQFLAAVSVRTADQNITDSPGEVFAKEVLPDGLDSAEFIGNFEIELLGSSKTLKTEFGFIDSNLHYARVSEKFG